MKEIGGYLELECGQAPAYHQGAVLLNSARNALRYIVRAYRVKDMFVPYYTCPVVWQALEAEQVKLNYYSVNAALEIDGSHIPQNAFVLVNNYFGIKGNYIADLARQYQNLIVDNAQAFYAPATGLASFYSPRKFFGLPDGGLALCDKTGPTDFEEATSYDLCTHLLKRYDLGASAGYADFQKNDDSLVGQPVQKMSRLTQALMGNIDYAEARRKRLKNFAVLATALTDKNELAFSLSSDDVPMVYPFLTHGRGLRQKLIQNKIYVARYWPEIEEKCAADSVERYLQQNLLPLPIDQRYDESDMNRILEVIYE